MPSLQCPKAEESEGMKNRYSKEHFYLENKNKTPKRTNTYLHITAGVQFQPDH